MKKQAVTREMILEDVKRLHDIHGQVNWELYTKYGTYGKSYVQKYFGGFGNVYKELGIERYNPKKGRNEVSKEDFIEDIKRVVSEHGRVDEPLYRKHGKYGTSYIWTYFKGMKNLHKELGMQWRSYNELDTDELLSDVRRVYAEYGYVSKTLYEEKGKHSVCALMGRYDTFNDMLRDLNIPVNQDKMSITKEDIIERMWELYEEHGYLTSELQRKESGFSQALIDNRFGSFNNLLAEMGLKFNIVRLSEDEMISELRRAYDKYGYLNRSVIDEECSTTYQAVTWRLGGREQIAIRMGIPANELFKARDGSSSKVDVLTRILDDMLGVEYIPEHSFEWLVNPKTGKRLYLDIYIPQLKLAIEYDGEQHFNYFAWFHKSYEDFLDAIERDRAKEELLYAHGVNLIRFNYRENLNQDTVSEKLSMYLSRTH